MKGFKKLLTVILSAAMLFTMGMPAAAADTGADSGFTITITNKDAGHVYEAYQVFSGDLTESDGKKVLSNIEWGNGIKNDKFLKELKENSMTQGAFGSAVSAEDVANALKDQSDNSELMKAFADVAGEFYSTAAGSSEGKTVNGVTTYTISNLEAGYYLVKDRTYSVPAASAYTDFILCVVGNAEVTAKADSPTVIKKVKEESYAVDDGYGEGYNDAADYSIGDKVPFKLIGTLPNASTYASYTEYSYKFTDTLSKGLAFNNDVVVRIGANTIDAKDYTVELKYDTENKSTELTISFEDLKKIVKLEDVNEKVIVTYTATLTSDANIGRTGNINEVTLTYSNNPNGDGTGTTPKDYVVVFTYEVDTTKRAENESGQTLKNAQFVLYRKTVDGKYEAVKVDKADTENNKPEGTVAGWSEVELEADPQNISAETNEALLANTNISILTSDAEGLFKVIGLDAGTYYLREVKAPDGYNLLKKPQEIVISSTMKDRQSWTEEKPDNILTALNVNVGQADVKNGICSLTIVNKSGTTLPSTGGMGTTIFYLVGGILLMGAFVGFVVKRRMAAQK